MERLRGVFTFQISVDVDNIPLGLTVAEAGVAAGVDIIEMGTPLLKTEGVRHVVPAFRQRFPDALLLADMKTMDGGVSEARGVFSVGGNIVDFLAAAGEATARNICGVRDEFRAADPDMPRLVFADIVVPLQAPAERAVEVARAMLAAGVDGIGIHLQLDARRANPDLQRSNYLAGIARALLPVVKDRASLQVVGGLSVEQARGLAGDGFLAFVISGNLGLPDSVARYTLPPDEIRRLIERFIGEVSGPTQL